jgi:hypothetical protein
MPDATPRGGDLPFVLAEPGKPSRRRGFRVALGGAGIAAALVFGLMRPAAPATVQVRNALVHPVALTLADGSVRRLEPGDSVRVTWSSSGAFEASWRLLRPASRTGQPMGEPLAGVLREERPRGTVRRSIDAGALGGEFFAPRVTNSSGVPLRLAVEQEGGALLCNCDVPVGAADEPMGYYRLARRTVIRLRDDRNRDVPYEMRDPIRERLSGVVAMRVQPSHLPRDVQPELAQASATGSRPPRRPGIRPMPSRHDVLAATAPVPVEPTVSVAEDPAPPLEPVLESPPAPAPEKPAPRRSSNPAAGFLPVR